MAHKILYVEDARPFQRMLQRMLEDVGELTIAASTEQGWECLSRESYKLVICDFMFPEGDAFPLLFKIRKQFTPDQLPIIMLTSAADRVTVSKFHGVGVNAAVRKPPEALHFRDLVFRMMRQPWIERPEYVAGDVQLFTWANSRQAYVFCPNLEIQTKAETSAEAMRLMHEAVRARIAQGESIPTISDPKTTTFFPSVTAAPPAIPPLAVTDAMPAAGS
jgi:DNA-binding response OmpR family regulator